MRNIRPNLVLLKPQAPRKESDCEREALRFLKSWRRAVERQAIQGVTHAKRIKIAPTESKGSTGAAVV